jgi:cytosine/uracil/thiamine/allantoin permease
VLGAFIGPLFGILIADFYLIKRGKVSVDDLFDDTPKGNTGTATALTRKPSRADPVRCRGPGD